MSVWTIGSNGSVAQDYGALAVRLYRASPEAAAVELVEADRRAMTARRPLRWVAVSHTVAAAAAVVALWQPVAAGDGRAELVASCAVGVAAAFWAVWGWSALSPLPAAVVGLVMYVTLSGLAVAARLPELPGQRWTEAADPVVASVTYLVAAGWVLAMVALLGRAVVAATRVRRAAGVAVPATGVLPAIGLYLLLLSVLAAGRTWTAGMAPTDGLLLTMGLFAAVTVAACAAGWRTLWPALADAGTAWLAVGVLLGLGTFSVASVYTDGLSAALHLPVAGTANPWVDAGYGWAGAFAATALFPAVFEELAFRGYIMPRLARSMTGGEAVVVSGVLFAVLHLNLSAVPFLLPTGVALGWLRRRSGSVWPCILMHLAHNAAVLAAARWM